MGISFLCEFLKNSQSATFFQLFPAQNTDKYFLYRIGPAHPISPSPKFHLQFFCLQFSLAPTPPPYGPAVPRPGPSRSDWTRPQARRWGTASAASGSPSGRRCGRRSCACGAASRPGGQRRRMRDAGWRWSFSGGVGSISLCFGAFLVSLGIFVRLVVLVSCLINVLCCSEVSSVLWIHAQTRVLNSG